MNFRLSNLGCFDAFYRSIGRVIYREYAGGLYRFAAHFAQLSL